MAETEKADKKKTPRAKKRNFSKIVSELRSYCIVNLEVLTDMRGPTDGARIIGAIDGKIEAFEKMLAKLGTE